MDRPCVRIDRPMPMWSECITICRINSCCPHGQYVSRCVAPVHAVHMVRVSHNRPCQFMLSTWSVCITMCCTSSCCPHGQHYCPCGQSVSQYAVSIHTIYMVRVSRDLQCQFMLSTWSVCITMCCINSCDPHDQHYCPAWSECLQPAVSIHIVHMVRVSRDLPCQFMRSTWSALLPVWSECLAICRINSCYPHGQHVSRCVAPVHAVHMVRVSHNLPCQFMLSIWSALLPVWSECLAICRINSCCPHGHSVSRSAVSIHAVHVVRVPTTCSVNSYCPRGQHYCPRGQSAYNLPCQFTLSTWSECPTIRRVNSHCPLECLTICHINSCRPRGQSAYNLPCQFILSTWSALLPAWSECLTFCRINSHCPLGQSVSQYAVSIHAIHMISIIAPRGQSAYNMSCQFILSTWSALLPMWSECITFCRINSHCPLGQCVSQSAVSIHAVHVARRDRPILSMCPAICRINSRCAWSSYVVRACPVYCESVTTDPIYCNMAIMNPIYCESVITDPIYCEVVITDPIYCEVVITDPIYCEVVITDPIYCGAVRMDPIYCRCGHDASQYIVSIRSIHMVSMSHHILLMWSECLIIYCVNPYCLHAQHVPSHIALVQTVPHKPLCNHDDHAKHRIVSRIKKRVDDDMVHHIIEMLGDQATMPNMGSMRLPYGQSVSPYAVPIHGVHTVRVSHNMPYQFIVSMWSECLTICRTSS